MSVVFKLSHELPERLWQQLEHHDIVYTTDFHSTVTLHKQCSRKLNTGLHILSKYAYELTRNKRPRC